MDDRAPEILLDYTADEILALIGEQAKIAFQAELDFFECGLTTSPPPSRHSWKSMWNGSIAASPMRTAMHVSRGNIRTS